jgi:hypothetical protein
MKPKFLLPFFQIFENHVQFLLHPGFALFESGCYRNRTCFFQYLKNWQKDFWLKIFFQLRYFIEVIAERMADIPHPKSFSKQFNRGDAMNAGPPVCSLGSAEERDTLNPHYNNSFNHKIPTMKSILSSPSQEVAGGVLGLRVALGACRWPWVVAGGL